MKQILVSVTVRSNMQSRRARKRIPRHVLTLLLAGIASAVASAQPKGGTAIVNERTYDLKIVGVTPAGRLLEHQPIQIEYRLQIGETYPVLGGLSQMAASVCPSSKQGNCVAIPDLKPGGYHGVIQSFAPSAGAAVRLKLKVVTTVHMLGRRFSEEVQVAESDAFPLQVAARYEVAIDKIAIVRPRAKTKDTVKISLRAGLQGQPTGSSVCDIVGGGFCVTLAPQGDLDGTPDGARSKATYAVNNVRVGSFDLIPEVSDNLAFQYDVENFGTPYEQKVLTEVLNDMSTAAAGILDAVMNGKSFDKLDDFAHKIHGLDQCDGPVAVDAKRFLNKSNTNLPGLPTLDLATRATGRFTSEPTSFEGTDSGLGCGRNSLYEVTWSVTRTSWQAL
jgi:hypothetical protein